MKAQVTAETAVIAQPVVSCYGGNVVVEWDAVTLQETLATLRRERLSEVEACPICGGIISHRIGCPWWTPPDDEGQLLAEAERIKARANTYIPEIESSG
jgi:hypothetical protein